LGKGFWIRPGTLATTSLLLLVLFVPVLRDRENAYFVVEAANPVILHSAVSGRVEAVYVREGDEVRIGQTLLLMSSADVGGMASSARAAMGTARYHAIEAQLGGQSVGASAAIEEAARRSGSLAEEAQDSLTVKSTVDGRVLTSQPGELIDQQVGSGEPLLTLAGGNSGQEDEWLRLYIPAGAMNRIQPGDEVAIAPPGHFSVIRTRLMRTEGESATLPQGLVAHQDYKGIVLPTFYCARLKMERGSPLLPLGIAGPAKVFGSRRSLAARIGEVTVDLVRAHVW